LGIKPGLTVVTINTPANYRRLLGAIPEGVTFSDYLKPDSSFVHMFINKRSELEKQLAILREKIADTGPVWVSWPKRSSGVSTDVTEDVVRAVALPLGFVDVKVCAIDETWSGLKLMVRRENRKRAVKGSCPGFHSGALRGTTKPNAGTQAPAPFSHPLR